MVRHMCKEGSGLSQCDENELERVDSNEPHLQTRKFPTPTHWGWVGHVLQWPWLPDQGHVILNLSEARFGNFEFSPCLQLRLKKVDTETGIRLFPITTAPNIEADDVLIQASDSGTRAPRASLAVTKKTPPPRTLMRVPELSTGLGSIDCLPQNTSEVSDADRGV